MTGRTCVILVESYILHCQFTCFLELAVDCVKMCIKIDPISMDWVHPIPGFYCILELPRLVEDGVVYVRCLYMGVQESSQF